ncbi:hypothetical protein N9E48_07330 [Paracoccaceae bacterium]|nr:hypothetical protein [Paracoccaceae bacterium]
MVSRKLMNVAQLRELLLAMEKDLRLGHLSQNEKDVFYAVNSVIGLKKNIAKSEDIKNHDLVLDMTQPTFHRCLKNLVNMGFLAHAPSTKAGSYVSALEDEDQFSETLSA